MSYAKELCSVVSSRRIHIDIMARMNHPRVSQDTKNALGSLLKWFNAEERTVRILYVLNRGIIRPKNISFSDMFEIAKCIPEKTISVSFDIEQALYEYFIDAQKLSVDYKISGKVVEAAVAASLGCSTNWCAMVTGWKFGMADRFVRNIGDYQRTSVLPFGLTRTTPATAKAIMRQIIIETISFFILLNGLAMKVVCFVGDSIYIERDERAEVENIAGMIKSTYGIDAIKISERKSNEHK